MATEWDEEVGRLLRYFRQSRGITQVDLGCFWGVSFQQVQKYENGANRLSAGKLIALLKAHCLTLEEFLTCDHRDEWDQFRDEPRQIPAEEVPLPITLEDVRRRHHERKLDVVK
jgi:transcriptional regulator with XRE-family HTH domain